MACSQAGLAALASLLSRELQAEEHLLQLLAAVAMFVQVALELLISAFRGPMAE